MKNYVLYNPLSGNGRGEKSVNYVKLPEGDAVFLDVTEISDYSKFFDNLEKDDRVVICGGDGTLNRFINDTEKIDIKNDVLYLAAGSGNDFLNDINLKPTNMPVKINEYIKNLPMLTVNGKSYRLVNGAGYGLDGLCCLEKEKAQKKGKKGNYALIALKCILYAFKPRKATVCVDGVEYKYSRVWMTSAMFGRYFGGGIPIAPIQDRNNSDGCLSVIVAHNLNKLRIILLFLSIFKGNHIKYKKYVALHKCHEVTVKFDVPSPLQIDGEVIPDVQSYTVCSGLKAFENAI